MRGDRRDLELRRMRSWMQAALDSNGAPKWAVFYFFVLIAMLAVIVVVMT